MAITFSQEQKKQRYLLFILIAIVSVALLIVWLGFFRKGASVPTPAISPGLPLQKLDINWDILKDERLKDLRAIEKISLPQESVGRKNPFVPY